jgi:hypothetical protein
VVHFGLGSAASIDRVTVRWVGGVTETVTGVQPGGIFKIVQGAGAATRIK